MTERKNFYKWMKTCPLINYRISDEDKDYVTYIFQFNPREPDIDQLFDDILVHTEK